MSRGIFVHSNHIHRVRTLSCLTGFSDVPPLLLSVSNVLSTLYIGISHVSVCSWKELSEARRMLLPAVRIERPTLVPVLSTPIYHNSWRVTSLHHCAIHPYYIH